MFPRRKATASPLFEPAEGRGRPPQGRQGLPCIQGLRSQQGAWRAVAQWASDSGTWGPPNPDLPST